MIVAIDGPAGSGKSTVAKAVARRLHMHYLDTGAMYRSVAWAALERGVGVDVPARVEAVARALDIAFEHDPETGLPTRVYADGVDVTASIRTPEIDDAVSAVARMPEVRAAMVPAQREEAAHGDLVAEGRDIGTVVFPHAEVKIFLTADPKERARRRHAELEARGEAIDASAVQERMYARDTADSSREAAPLVAAEDAIVFDTTGMTIEQVVNRIVLLAQEAR